MAKNFGGRWESDFGLLELSQNADSVTGSYSCCNGTINGKIMGSRLDFSWSDSVYGNGWGRFVLSAGGDRLEGSWGYAGQENTNGSWNAVRFVAPSQRGVPTYWTVRGETATVGSLTGTAELFINEDKVSGQIEGRYTIPIDGQPQYLEVFNYVNGIASDRSMRLKWRNPVDGTGGTMDLNRSRGQLNGTWTSDDGKSRGTISMIEVRNKAKAKKADLPSLLERQTKRQRAEHLLHNAVESNSSDEVIAKYQEAARLFRELGNPNKVGYAPYGQATEELNHKHYDNAHRLYQEVLDLGDDVDPTIRMLATNGLRSIDLAREVDAGANFPAQAPEALGEDNFQQSDDETGIEVSPRMVLKHKAFDLVLKSPEGCKEAILMLEEALALYRKDRGDARQHPLMREGSLIDEINILTQLVYCHLMLGNEQGFAQSIAGLVKVREETSRVPHLTRFANPAGGAFQQVAAFIDIWRGRFKTDRDKKQATERIKNTLSEAVRFLVDSGNPAEAFVLSENMRGRAFGDLIASKVDVMAAIRAGHIDSSYVPSPGVTAYLPLTDLLGIVSEHGSTIIEYHVLDDAMLIWVIRPQPHEGKRINMVKVPMGEKTLKPLVQVLRHLIDPRDVKGGFSGGEVRVVNPDVRRLLSELYKHLIEPIPKSLLPAKRSEPVTIIPHGILFNVPFAALVNAKMSAGGFLAEQYATTFSTSIAILRLMETTEHTRKEIKHSQLLAFVNPSPMPTVDSDLSALPLTEKHFPRLAGLYPNPEANTVLYGNRASSDALNKLAPSYSVIYFGTHAEADEADPTASWIALSGKGDVGKVTISRVLQTRLHADLVILAACETGLGQITGDGVDGLGRAFIFAGARALLASLWKVGELQTLDLMYEFHKEWLRHDVSKAEALRRAQVALSKKNPDQPELWSGFVLIGDWR